MLGNLEYNKVRHFELFVSRSRQGSTLESGHVARDERGGWGQKVRL